MTEYDNVVFDDIDREIEMLTMGMAMSPEMKEKFKQRMNEQIERNAVKAEKSAEEVKKEVESAFAKVKDRDAGDNEEMFSTLFFDPAEIDMPDFPVGTFFHEHDDWPDWVKASVPEPDPHYQWNKQATYEFVANEDEHVFLVGMPGSGKTSLPYQVAAVIGRPVYKQSFQNDLEADEWLMSKEIDDTGTHWHVLPFVQSLEYPFYTVCDEFNRLRRGGRLLMNPLLDIGGTLPLRDGRVIVPHAKWRAVATDNTRGLGDGLDLFDGDVSDISTTDRFGLMLEIGYLPHDQQVTLLQSWLPDLNDTMADEIVTFGEKVVVGFKAGKLPLPWTPRRMLKAAKMTLRYRNPVKGIKSAYYSFLAEDKERGLCNQFLKDIGMARKYGEFA